MADDPAEDEQSARICDACGAASPATQTPYTLIGSKHGWRTVKVTGADGRPKLVYYCPPCWQARKTG